MSDERIEHWLKYRCREQDLRQRMIDMAAWFCVYNGEHEFEWRIEMLDIVSRRAFAEHVKAGRMDYIWERNGPLYPELCDGLSEWLDRQRGQDDDDVLPEAVLQRVKGKGRALLRYLWDGKRATIRQLRKDVWKKDVTPGGIQKMVDRTNGKIADLTITICDDEGKSWFLEK